MGKLLHEKELFNCSEWPDLTYKRTICPLPCETDDGVAVDHPVRLMHIAQVMVIFHYIRWFYCIPLVIGEITFCWCTMDIHQHVNFSLIPSHYFCNITLFQFHFLGSWGLGHTLLVWCGNPTSPPSSSHHVSHGGKEIVHLRFLTTSFHFSHWLTFALKCCAMHCLSFLKYTFLSQVV